MKFSFTQMNETDAREIVAWRYEAPYDFYNSDKDEMGAEAELLSNPANAYYALRNEDGDLIGYYCFGREARVEGGDYDENAVDIGGGLRPDMTGSGFGSTFMQIGRDFAAILFGGAAIRTTVAAFNLRALKVCENAGFESVQRFQGPKGTEFVVLTNRDGAAT